MDYKIEIKPAIAPRLRHRLENLMKEAGFEIHGGGTCTDLSSCDFTCSREDPRDDLKKQKK